MSRKNLLLFFAILLISILIVWYINQFLFPFLPTEWSNPFGVVLSVLVAITTIQGAIVAVNWLGEFFFPPPPSPSEIDILKQELRTLSSKISEEVAREYTAKIIGEKHNMFWEKISSNTINSKLLRNLTSDSFWLEGLIDLYRQGKDECFSKNQAILLKNLLLIQWKQEKIGGKGFVDLNTAEVVLSLQSRKIRNISSFQPTYNLTSNQRNYTHLLESLSIRSLYWLKIRTILINVLNSIYQKNNFFGSLVKVIIKVFNFSYLIKSIKRKRGQALLEKFEKAHILVREGYNVDFSSSYWEKYFEAIAYLNPSFTGKDFKEGFKIVDKSKIDISEYHNPAYWHREDLRQEEVAIMMCGLSDNPSEYISQILKINPYLAGVCMVSIDANNDPLKYYIDSVVRWLLEMLQTNPMPDTPKSYILSNLLLKLRNNPSFILEILDTVEKDLRNGIYFIFSHLDFANLIAQYGQSAVPILRNKWHVDLSIEVQKIIIIALAKIKSHSARDFLYDIMQTNEQHATSQEEYTLSWEEAKYYATRYYAAVALTLYYDEWGAHNFLQDALQGKKDTEQSQNKEFKKGWMALSIAGEQSFSLAYAALRALRRRYRSSNSNEAHNVWKNAYGSFLHHFVGDFHKQAFAETKLLELLNDSDNELQMLALAGLQRIEKKGEKTIQKMYHLLDTGNERIRLGAISVLASVRNIRDARILHGLVSSLYDKNTTIVATAIIGLGEAVKSELITAIEKIRLLIGKLKDDRFIIEVSDNDINHPIRDIDGNEPRSKPISLLAMEGICTDTSGWLGEIYEKYPSDWNAMISWCESHIEDKREVKYGKTISHYASIFSEQLKEWERNYEMRDKRPR